MNPITPEVQAAIATARGARDYERLWPYVEEAITLANAVETLAAEVERLRDENESLHGQVEFGKHLNKCTIEVAQWPEWKKVLIGDNKTSLAAILNDYIQLQARVTVVIATLSHRIIQSLSEQHGSLRAASRAVGLSPTYLCQVARGNATLSIERTIEILRSNPLEGDE